MQSILPIRINNNTRMVLKKREPFPLAINPPGEGYQRRIARVNVGGRRYFFTSILVKKVKPGELLNEVSKLSKRDQNILPVQMTQKAPKAQIAQISLKDLLEDDEEERLKALHNIMLSQPYKMGNGYGFLSQGDFNNASDFGCTMTNFNTEWDMPLEFPLIPINTEGNDVADTANQPISQIKSLVDDDYDFLDLASPPEDLTNFSCFDTHILDGIPTYSESVGEENKSYIVKFLETVPIRKQRAPDCARKGFNFGSCAALSTHMIIHAGQHFTCVVCSKTFGEEIKLLIHSVEHLTDRPYKCPSCANLFSNKSFLKIHVKRHSGEMHFVCFICNKVYVKRCNLRTHLKKVHKQCGNTYICTCRNGCDLLFASSNTTLTNTPVILDPSNNSLF